MVELLSFGAWLDPQLALQCRHAAPVLLHRTVPPAGDAIIAHEGVVRGLEARVKVQQVLGHLDRLHARAPTRQRLAPGQQQPFVRAAQPLA